MRAMWQDVRSAALGLAALLMLAAASTPAAAQIFPQLTGRVVDEAQILDAGTRAALTQKLADLEARTTDQLVVVTVRSLQGRTIEEYGVGLGRARQIGQQGKNNGVLLLVAPTDRKVRIEVGYGLEGVLPDAVASYIIQQTILPRFRTGDFTGGIGRGVDNIVSALSGDAAEWKARAARAQPSRFTRTMHGISATLSWLPQDLVIVLGLLVLATVLSLLSLVWLWVLLPLLLWLAIALGLGSPERWAALARRQRAWHFLSMLEFDRQRDHVRLVVVLRLVLVVLRLRLFRRRRQLRRRRIVGKLVRRLISFRKPTSRASPTPSALPNGRPPARSSAPSPTTPAAIRWCRSAGRPRSRCSSRCG